MTKATDTAATVNQPTRILSYGGGLDSWVMLLLAIDGKLPKPDLVVFADVSNGSPEADPTSTYRHIREVVMPLCEKHGIEFKWLTTEEVPVRVSSKHPEGFRSLFDYYRSQNMFFGATSKVCTISSKVDRVGKYVEARFPEGALEVWIGFGADEETRLKRNAYVQKGRRTERYPLMEREMCRCREEAYARASGYPVPRKSACVFCPHSSRGDFRTLRDQLPEVFVMIEELEDNAKLTKSGKRMRYSGTGDDAKRLREWVESAFKGIRENQDCHVCGSKKSTKRTGCDYLVEGGQACDDGPQGVRWRAVGLGPVARGAMVKPRGVC